MSFEHSKSRSTLRIHQMDDVESFGHHTTLELAPRHNNNNNAVPTNSSEGVRERSLNLPEDPNRPLYKPHQSANAQYLRDAILGVNDGLVSMFLLILGLAGGNLTSQQILLAGITGAAAGAISMALGEYIATKSQAQVTKAELELEKEHLMFHREKEIAEVKTFLEELSLEGELLDRVLAHISKNDTALIRLMSAFEFGFQEELERSPLKAMLMSGCLFISGSLPSVIPFAVTSNVHDALIASVVLCAFTLFFVGAIKTRTTKGPWLWDGLENLFLGAIGGGITYALGAAYEAGSNN